MPVRRKNGRENDEGRPREMLLDWMMQGGYSELKERLNNATNYDIGRRHLPSAAENRKKKVYCITTSIYWLIALSFGVNLNVNMSKSAVYPVILGDFQLSSKQ